MPLFLEPGRGLAVHQLSVVMELLQSQEGELFCEGHEVLLFLK